MWRLRNQVESAGRSKRFSAAMVVIGAVLLVGLAAGVFLTKVAASRTGRDVRVQSKTTTTPSSIGNFLDSPNVKHSIGQIAFFNNVQLRPGPTSKVLFAQDAQGHRMVVVPDSVAPNLNEEGVLADISGEIAPVPSVKAIVKGWKLPKKDAEQIQRDGVYLRADRIVSLK